MARLRNGVEYRWKIPDIALYSEGKSKEVFTKNATRTLNNMTIILEQNMKKTAPVGHTAQLINSIQTAVKGFTGSVFSTAKYASIINRGRGAAPVSRDASIEAWIRLSKKGQLYLSSLRATYGPKTSIKQAAFLLRRSMKRRPRKANPFWDRGRKKSVPGLEKEANKFLTNLKNGLLK